MILQNLEHFLIYVSVCWLSSITGVLIMRTPHGSKVSVTTNTRNLTGSQFTLPPLPAKDRFREKGLEQSCFTKNHTALNTKLSQSPSLILISDAQSPRDGLFCSAKFTGRTYGVSQSEIRIIEVHIWHASLSSSGLYQQSVISKFYLNRENYASWLVTNVCIVS